MLLDNSQIKIIFWGTPEFALPSLEALMKQGYAVAAVVTNPDEPIGRKQVLTPPATKVLAEKYGIPVLQPHTLANYELRITNYKPGLFVVAAYGKIIPKDILDIPKYGALGIHPSLLPRLRGPSPIQYAILNGDTETGVTIFKVDEKMDHGPILALRELEILNHKSETLNKFSAQGGFASGGKTQSPKITYKKLHDQLANMGAELLLEVLPRWLNGEIKPVPQDDSKATYSNILKKEDGKIEWSKSVEAIERHIRAFEDWPGSYTFWQRGKHQLRLEIERAEALPAENKNINRPGMVWQSDSYTLLVQAGSGSIEVRELRPAGKKSLTAKEFLNGYRDIVGATLQ